MKGRRAGLLVVVFGLVLAVAGAAFGQSVVAEITYLEGDVSVQIDGALEFADFGTPLAAGDSVVTGDDGLAIVMLASGAEIKLRANTTVAMGTLIDGAAVELRSGGVFARVAESAIGRRAFEVRTPTVVAGVRGTEFFVAYGRTIEDAPDLWLCVNEGSVEVDVEGQAESTIVNEGEGINILGGRRATDPRFFAWTTELNWNFDAGAGDVVDDTDLDGAYSDLLDQDYD